jgi:hypothetical protein
MQHAAITVPQSAETIMVEFTVKEAMALGQHVRFAMDKEAAASAKRKIARTLERKLLPHAAKIDYYALQR